MGAAVMAAHCLEFLTLAMVLRKVKKRQLKKEMRTKEAESRN